MLGAQSDPHFGVCPFVPRRAPGQPTAFSQSNPVTVQPLCHRRLRDGGSPRIGHREHPEEGGIWDVACGYPGRRWRSSQATLRWKCWEPVTPGGPLAQGQNPSPSLLWMMRLQQRGNPVLGFPRGIAQEV